MRLLVIYQGNDVSGFKPRKKDTQWWRVLSILNSRRPPYLLGAYLPRFRRNQRELLELADVCRETGTVGVLDATEW